MINFYKIAVKESAEKHFAKMRTFACTGTSFARRSFQHPQVCRWSVQQGPPARTESQEALCHERRIEESSRNKGWTRICLGKSSSNNNYQFSTSICYSAHFRLNTSISSTPAILKKSYVTTHLATLMHFWRRWSNINRKSKLLLWYHHLHMPRSEFRLLIGLTTYSHSLNWIVVQSAMTKTHSFCKFL